MQSHKGRICFNDVPEFGGARRHRPRYRSITEAPKCVAVNREFVQLHNLLLTGRARGLLSRLSLEAGDLFLQSTDQFV